MGLALTYMQNPLIRSVKMNFQRTSSSSPFSRQSPPDVNKLAYEVLLKTKKLQDLQHELNTLIANSKAPSTSPSARQKLRDTEQRLIEEQFNFQVLEHMRARQKWTVDILKDRVVILTDKSELSGEKLRFAQSTLEEAELTRIESQTRVNCLRDFIQEARLQRQNSLEERLISLYDSIDTCQLVLEPSAYKRENIERFKCRLLQRKAKHQELLEVEQVLK